MQKAINYQIYIYTHTRSTTNYLSIEDSSPSSSSSPITFKVIFSSFVAACGSYVYGHAVGYSSPAQEGIMEDLGLTTKQYPVFSSIMTVGAMLGAVLSGRVADFVGRRAAMGSSELFCIFGWLAIVLSKDATWLIIGRFVLGSGIGIVSYPYMLQKLLRAMLEEHSLH